MQAAPQYDNDTDPRAKLVPLDAKRDLVDVWLDENMNEAAKLLNAYKIGFQAGKRARRIIADVTMPKTKLQPMDRVRSNRIVGRCRHQWKYHYHTRGLTIGERRNCSKCGEKQKVIMGGWATVP